MNSTKRTLILATVLASSLSFAGPVPKAIKARYNELKVSMRKLDFEAFASFFAPEFVNVDPKGVSTNRDDFMAGLKPMFEANKKGVPVEKLISATTKDGVVGVKFDFRFDLIGDAGTTKVHEVGTDYWKKIDGKWMFVKTVDTAFTIKEPKTK